MQYNYLTYVNFSGVACKKQSDIKLSFLIVNFVRTKVVLSVVDMS